MQFEVCTSNSPPVQEMTREEASVIRDFSLCDFTAIHQYYKEKSEARKQMTKEEKAKLKEENEKITEEYGWCIIDGHRERIGNFKTEPPGLFRGRGDHPKQGKIKVSTGVLHMMSLQMIIAHPSNFTCIHTHI